MSVYVDSIMNRGWRLGMSCHMIADTLNELQYMAVTRLKLRRECMRLDRCGVGRYDLTLARRQIAVARGAIELSRKQFVLKLRELRQSGAVVDSHSLSSRKVPPVGAVRVVEKHEQPSR